MLQPTQEGHREEQWQRGDLSKRQTLVARQRLLRCARNDGFV